jgi:excisionase family DNA binding protein
MRNTSKWLTPAEVARRAGVTSEAVRQWADRGLLPAERTETGRRLFDASFVEAFLQLRQRRHEQRSK